MTSPTHELMTGTRDALASHEQIALEESKMADRRAARSVATRLGILLQAKNIRDTAALIIGWDTSGDGAIDKKEFRTNVRPPAINLLRSTMSMSMSMSMWLRASL